MASKSVLDLFGRVIKAPLNGQPKLCMQLVKHLQLFNDESVKLIQLLINNVTLIKSVFMISVERTTAKRSVLCVNEIGTWIRVFKDTSSYSILFSFGCGREPLNR